MAPRKSRGGASRTTLRSEATEILSSQPGEEAASPTAPAPFGHNATGPEDLGPPASAVTAPGDFLHLSPATPTVPDGAGASSSHRQVKQPRQRRSKNILQPAPVASTSAQTSASLPLNSRDSTICEGLGVQIVNDSVQSRNTLALAKVLDETRHRVDYISDDVQAKDNKMQGTIRSYADVARAASQVPRSDGERVQALHKAVADQSSLLQNLVPQHETIGKEVANLTHRVQRMEASFESSHSPSYPIPTLPTLPPLPAPAPGSSVRALPSRPAAASPSDHSSRKHHTPPVFAPASPTKKLKFDPPGTVFVGPVQTKILRTPSDGFKGFLASMPHGNAFSLKYVSRATIASNANVIEVVFWSKADAINFVKEWSASPPLDAPINCIAVLSTDACLSDKWRNLKEAPRMTWMEREKAASAAPPVVTTRVLSVACWNINGQFAVKAELPEVSGLLMQHDITVIVESWLCPDQEVAVPLPDGFGILSSSRPLHDDLRAPRGGVAIIHRLTLPVVRQIPLPVPYTHDLLCVDFRDFILLAAYVVPPGANWSERQDVSPESMFLDAVRHVVALQKPVLVMGDLNCRVASYQVLSAEHRLPRLSLDMKTTTRGAKYCDFFDSVGLFILNGTALESTSPGSFTSHRHNGSAVVDYAIGSAAFLDLVQPSGLSVIHTPCDSNSDHSLVSLQLAVPDRLSTLPKRTTRGAYQSSQDVLAGRAHMRQVELDAGLNGWVRQLVATAASNVARTRIIYGPYLSGICAPHTTSVYLAATTAASAQLVAVYYGPGSPRNFTFSIPASRNSSNNTPFYYGVLHVLKTMAANGCIHLYLPAPTIIQMLCSDMATACTKQWNVKDDFVLKAICSVLSLANLRVDLRLVGTNQPNFHYQSAVEMLRARHHTPVPRDFLRVPVPSSWGACIVAECNAKVTTSMPLFVTPDTKPGKLVHIPEADIALSDASGSEDDGDDRLCGSESSHRGRAALRRKQGLKLNQLVNTDSIAAFWKQIKDIQDPKRRTALVSTEQLQAVFKSRLNYPEERRYSGVVLAALQEAALLPLRTVDVTTEAKGIFSRPVTTDEVAAAKKKLQKRSSNAATAVGADNVSIHQLLLVPNEDICKVVNKCISALDFPTDWLSTILVGVPKPGKDLKDPDGYRLIGLESCFLKFVMMLFERRLSEWATAKSVLPESQNGFRPGYRTNNNSYILRTACDQASANGKTLYVVFVDLKNAFPSTVTALLWKKLFDCGARGPWVDWVRVLYQEMRYIVRHDAVFGTFFLSNIGLLTGDTSSPGFWNVYFSDFTLPPLPGDVFLGNTRLSHLEQADDLVLMSYSPQELQSKLDAFVTWCDNNGMELSVSKTKWMWMGRTPRSLPTFNVNNGASLEMVSHYRYVGVTFDNNRRRNMFYRHYDAMTAKARTAAGATLALRPHLGEIPPHEGRLVFLGRVDPYLINAAEVVVDVTQSELTKLDTVQKWFLRRLLKLSRASLIYPLYVELNVMPIKYRRLHLAFRYLLYLVALPHQRLASAALHESVVLARNSELGWISDLQRACTALEVPVLCDLSFITNTNLSLDLKLKSVGQIGEAVLNAGRQWVQELVDSSSHIMLRKEQRVLTGKGVSPFLRVANPRHRNALIKLLTGDHRLAIESARGRAPRERRLCRLCVAALEDEDHVLLLCMASPTIALAREDFLDCVRAIRPSVAAELVGVDASARVKAFNRVLRWVDTLDSLARLAHIALKTFYAEPLYPYM